MNLTLKIETLAMAFLISTAALSASAQTLGGLETQAGELSKVASGGGLVTALTAIGLFFEGGVSDAPAVQAAPTDNPRPTGKWLQLSRSKALKPRFQAAGGGGGTEPGQDKGDITDGTGIGIGGLPDIMDPAKPKK